MNLYLIKLTDDQKAALEHLFNIGIVLSKPELNKAWEQLREQVREASCTVSLINAFRNSECNCKKPTEPDPKYDPCRRLKKGDKVRYAPKLGRFEPGMTKGTICTVLANEIGDGRVFVEYTIDKKVYTATIFFCFLELISPVEEKMPYSVHESEVVDGFDIVREKMCVMTFPYGPKEAGYYLNKLAAKKAAEAERDRLNAEWRKEKK